MTKPRSNFHRLLSRGVWFLVVGVLTSWLLGVGLFFIAAAAVCAFAGLFRERIVASAALLAVTMLLGFFCLHVAAVSGIFAYHHFHRAKANPISTAKVK